MRRLTIVMGCFVSLCLPAASQDRIVFDDDAPRQYNESIQPIYDQIDSLYNELQDDSLSMEQAASLIEQQSALRSQADALWDATQDQIDTSFRNARDAITQFNTENRQLDADTIIGGTMADVLNNVAKYPTRESFDANVPAMSQAWEQNYGSRIKPFGDDFAERKQQFFEQYKEKYGVDLNATGYSRIGEINPYTGEVYYKYYGPDGNLIAGQWENDANGYDKWKADNDAYIRRRRDQRDQLQRQSDGLKQFSTSFNNDRQNGQSRLATLEKAANKVNFVGSWSGNDNVGNWLRLTLNSDGTTRYTWGRDRTIYDNTGRWSQVGGQITMRTDDGEWSHESTITEQNQLQFIEIHSSGDRYTNYLRR